MSISLALVNALSGLTAASRSIEVVSSNVSNAATPGYGRREVELAQRLTGDAGSGVHVVGVSRQVDAGLLRDLRLADADVSGNDARLSFFSGLDGLVGTTSGNSTLSNSIAQLGAALTEASSAPDSTARLSAVANAAKAVAETLNGTSKQIQSARIDADREIGEVTEKLNADLQDVVDLNVQIRKLSGSGRDAGALMDQRQLLIDGISRYVPIREIQRDNGTVALYTSGGASLVDGKAAVFSFTAVGMIVPDMTIESGALGKLSINGREINTAGEAGPIGGGRLGALFQIRDELAPRAQAALDSVARDLVERFSDPAVDPTIGVADPGLFTDSGNALVAADESGLAARISVNPAVDPSQGGALWRLRAGVYAAAPNDAGDGSLLVAMSDALSAARSPSSGPFAGTTRSAGALSDELSASWGGETMWHERTQNYLQARANSLRDLHLQDGVDTDQEMERLLILEQSYAANARVISTVDNLLQMLMEI